VLINVVRIVRHESRARDWISVVVLTAGTLFLRAFSPVPLDLVTKASAIIGFVIFGAVTLLSR
jgi:hypothetical protein